MILPSKAQNEQHKGRYGCITPLRIVFDYWKFDFLLLRAETGAKETWALLIGSISEITREVAR